jgi:hypothetical protein
MCGISWYLLIPRHVLGFKYYSSYYPYVIKQLLGVWYDPQRNR